MTKIISIIFLLQLPLFAQNSGYKNEFLSPENVKKFADYLFCQHDYLRSVEEYKRYLKSISNDTVNYLIGEAYSKIGNYSAAADYYQSVFHSAGLASSAQLNYLKSIFQINNPETYRKIFNKENLNTESSNYSNALELYNYSYLFGNNGLPDKEEFLKPYTRDEKFSLEKLYDFKTDPPYKSPVKAAILSAIIPGAGKFYTHDYADGIVAILTTGVLSYIAYTDFHAGHNFRGWLFVSLASGFYAGNIYGAAASAQIFNAKIKFDFTNELRSYLKKVNFFIPSFNFCIK